MKKTTINNIYILITILVILLLALIVIITNISVNKRDNSLNEIEKNKLIADYETKFEEFKNLSKKIEQKVSDRLLDGSVYDDITLENKIIQINKILLKNDFKELQIFDINPFKGVFYLNKNGKLRFKFDNGLAPSWVNNEDIKEYFI